MKHKRLMEHDFARACYDRALATVAALRGGC